MEHEIKLYRVNTVVVGSDNMISIDKLSHTNMIFGIIQGY